MVQGPAERRVARLGSRGLFPELQARAYLSHAAIAPASLPVCAAVREAMADYAASGQGAFAKWADRREQLRSKLAALLGVSAEHLAFSSGTTHAITHLALAIPWQSGDKVLLFEGEFPANVTPWQQAASLYELEVVFNDLEGGERDPDRILGPLEARLKAGVRLVAVSAVQFKTGLRMPLEAMTALCHAYGSEIAVDCIQAAGIVPLNIERLGFDYATGGAHKWLMGIEGAGYLYAAPHVSKKLVPRTAGWLSHQQPIRFLVDGAGHLDYGAPLKQGAQVFEAGSGSVVSLAALEAGLEPLAQLGVDAIYRHVSEYLDALERGLRALGLSPVRASYEAGRSGILALEAPESTSVVGLAAELRARGVFASTPDGLLRFAPHFPNAVGEVAEVLSILEEVLGRRSKT